MTNETRYVETVPAYRSDELPYRRHYPLLDQFAVADDGFALFGRDEFFDGRLIAREIERRKPVPGLVRFALRPYLGGMQRFFALFFFGNKINALFRDCRILKANGYRFSRRIGTIEKDRDAAASGPVLEFAAAARCERDAFVFQPNGVKNYFTKAVVERL